MGSSLTDILLVGSLYLPVDSVIHVQPIVLFHRKYVRMPAVNSNKVQ